MSFSLRETYLDLVRLKAGQTKNAYELILLKKFDLVQTRSLSRAPKRTTHDITCESTSLRIYRTPLSYM